MLNFTTLASKLKYGIIASILLIANALSAQTYDANQKRVSFGGAGVTISHKVGTNGKTAGDLVLYENVITIGGQKIDALIKNVTLTNVTTFGEFDATTSSSASGQNDSFFSPQFNFSGSGSWKFNITFIKNGTYSATTKTGTAVNLINVVLNTYDIDGNGSTGTNQFNEFGDLKSYQLGSGTNITASYNSTSGLTKFRSNISTNSTSILADAQRVRVYFDTLSSIDFIVGAEAAGLAYFFLDFSVGPTFSTACNLALSTDNATNPSCAGTSTGSISLTTSGGTTPYTYSWSGPSNTKTTEDVTAIPAGSHTITVTDKNSCKQVKTITLTDPAAPTIIGSATACIGNTITLTGSGTANSSGPWTSSSTSIATVSSTGVVTGVSAGSATITYKNSAGCTATKAITVNASPSVTVSPTSANVNVGSSQTLTASGASTYSWTPSTGLSATTGTTVTASPTVTTTYTVTGTAVSGCTNTATSIITVNTPLTGGKISGSQSVCSGGDPTAFTSTTAASGGTGSITYQWQQSTNSGATFTDISTANSATYDVAAGITATTLYRRKATDAATTIKYSDTLTIAINALPTITGTTNACIGATTTLTGSGTAATSNAWVSATTAVATVSSAGVVTGVSAGTSVITYTNNNGCAKTETITINALPTISGSAEVCVGSTTTLTGSGTAAATNPWVSSNSAIASITSSGVMTGSSSGTATITYTNNNGCTITANAVVNSLPTISGSTSVCKFGTLSLTGSGTAASSTPWTSSNTSIATVSSTGSVFGVSSGTVTISYTNNKGCTETQIITVNGQPTVSVSPSSATISPGGSQSLTATGGSTYTWSPSATLSSATAGSVTATPSTTTTYEVIGTDSKGCSDTTQVTVTVLSSLSAGTVSGSQTICYGADPTAFTSSASASGGTGSLTTQWQKSTNSGSTWSDISGATSNTYDESSSVAVTTSYRRKVTDGASNVDYSNTITITVNSKPNIGLSAGNVSCFGGNNGSITTTITGGTSAFTYNWSGSSYSATTKDISSLSAGTFTLICTDNNSCKDTASVSVTEPASALSLSNSAQTNVLCFGNSTGAVTVAAAGGTSPYEYKIGTGAYASTATFSSLAAGSYTITAKDVNGCTQTLSVTITQPSAALSIATPSITNVGCKGASTGAISLTVSGGTTAYSYAWTGPSSYSATTKDISSLAAGTYSVTVTDANGCSASNASVSVTEPAAVLSLSNTAQTNVLCYGNSTGAVTVSAAGGTSPYEYKIGTGAYASTATFSSLAAGSYTITAKDANGCTQTLSVTITEPSAALSIATPSITNVGCKGASTGAVSLTVSGGTTSYSYAWTGPSSYSATTKDISSLAAGTYGVTVTDANGCSASNSSVYVTEPSAVLSVSNSAQTNVLCYGNSTGAVTVSAAGGTSPYEYKIGTGAYASTATFSSLAAGSYTITAKDANGCTQTLSVTITQPTAAISVTAVASNNVSCNGGNDGTITITATGGTTKKYSIDNGVNFQSSNVFSGLAAGNYTVVVSDNNSCSATLASGVSASVTLTQPNAISVTAVASTNISCNGGNDGTITITATGGTTKKYSIDNGTNFQSSNVFSGLAAGSYTIVVSDNNSCAGSFASGVSDTITLTEPNAISVTAIASTNPSCKTANDGTITITATGGNTLSYSIDNGTTYQSSNIFSGLGIGTYNVKVQDSKSCTVSYGSVNTTITLSNGDITKPTVLTKNYDAYLNNSGAITISYSNVNNGSSDNCEINAIYLDDSTFDCTNIGANTVTLTVTDIAGNTDTKTATVTVYDTISPMPKAKNLVVYLDATGNVSITAAQANNASTDNCSIKTLSLSKSNFSCADTGVNNSIKFTATDYSNNTAYTFFNVRVYDTISPAPKAKDLVVYLDATGNVSITAAQANNASTDNCSIKTLSLSKSNFSCADTGVNNSIKFTATDYSNNTAYTFFNVRVYDTISPAPKAKDLVVYLDATGNVSITAAQANNASTDNCSIKTLSLSKSNFSCADTGVNNSIKFTATDYSNNTAYTFFNVRVYDTISPAPKAKDLVVYLDATGNVSITAAQANNASTDNCSIKTLSLSKSNFSCADTGVNNSIKFTATDYSNNTAYTFFNVRVYDTISPAPKAKDLVVYLDATGNVSITAAQANNASTDNCSIKSLSLSKSNFSCADTGVNNSIKFTATDYSNNTAYTFFNVRVYDTISPAPKAKDLVVYLDATGNVSITAAQANNASTDNCSIKTLTLSKSNFSCADTGVNNSIKFTATDYSNNTAYTFFNVRVYDTISPAPKAKDLVVYLDATGNVSITAAQANNASTDNCSIKTLSLSKSNFSCADTGVNNSIKFTATDYSNNTAYTFFNVRVYDTISPAPKAKDLVVYLDATGNVSITAAQANNASTDNCSIKTLSLSKSNFSCADTGVNNSIKFTATDYSNNTAYTFFNVRVYDTISPAPKAKDLVVYLDATGNVSITAAQANNASTDNCSIKTLSLSKSNFSCADTGVNKGIVFTATDYSNNSASTSLNVTVLDTIKPTITVKTAIVYLDTAARASLTRAMFTVSTNDNCGVIDTTLSRYLVTLSDTGWNDVDVWVTDKSKNVTGPIRTKVLVLIADSDNDSIPDYIEGSKDYDGDGVFDYADLDSDNDGVLDVIENEGKDSLLDWDADGKPNHKDLDTDGDGIDDVIEVSGNDPDFDGIAGTGKAIVDANGVPTIASGGYKEVFTDSDAQPDYKDLDADDDTILDAIEKGATNNPVDTDGDGTGDWRDLDTDNDGISDKTETDIDTDGDGTGDWRDLDTDNDGIADKTETDIDTDGDGSGDWRDLDTDNDGIADKIETTVDTDGDGTGDWRDLDTDNDGIADKTETDIDTDGDGTGDWRDLDTDNDGIADKIETTVDTDGDGTGDWRDLDSDNDGISDKIETDIDTDGDGTGDWRDLDTDNDGISDKIETDIDTDGDGKGDWRDLDADNDGISDKIESDIDTDGDGKGDWRDLDSDNDGISDKIESDTDTDGDGKGDWRDLDSDNDQIPDKVESDIDTDGDGTGDWRDLDSDNDTLPDTKEAGDDPNNPTDTDGDGNADFRELDSDNDELPDEMEGLNNSKIPNIWIPEGISPNGDGINDLLYIKGLANFKNASVLIFNRWGQIVYESGNGYNNLNGFDGYYHGKGLALNTDQPLPENVYFLVFKSNDEKGLIIKQNLYIKAN
jgi:gliding motility-associated-like protein